MKAYWHAERYTRDTAAPTGFPSAQETFESYLKLLGQPGSYADFYPVIADSERFQRQQHLLKRDEQTGRLQFAGRPGTTVEGLDPSDSDLYLILDEMHYFVAIPARHIAKKKVRVSDLPAAQVRMQTEEGDDFVVFGVKADGNCYWRCQALLISAYGLSPISSFYFNTDGASTSIEDGLAWVGASSLDLDAAVELHVGEMACTSADRLLGFYAGHATQKFRKKLLVVKPTFQLVDVSGNNRPGYVNISAQEDNFVRHLVCISDPTILRQPNAPANRLDFTMLPSPRKKRKAECTIQEEERWKRTKMCAGMTDEIKTLETQIESSKVFNQDLQKKLDDLVKEREALAAAVASSTQSKQDLEAELSDVRKERESRRVTQNQVTTLKNELRDSESRVQSALKV